MRSWITRRKRRRAVFCSLLVLVLLLIVLCAGRMAAHAEETESASSVQRVQEQNAEESKGKNQMSTDQDTEEKGIHEQSTEEKEKISSEDGTTSSKRASEDKESVSGALEGSTQKKTEESGNRTGSSASADGAISETTEDDTGQKEAETKRKSAAKSMAGSTDMSQYITGIAISETIVKDRMHVKVTVTFGSDEEDTIVFHGGDTMYVSWSSSAPTVTSMEAYTRSGMALRNEDGLHLADADITKNDVKITFTDEVNDLKKVHGHVTFEAVCYNSSENSENFGTVTVSGGNLKASVDIYGRENKEEGEFLDKKGQQDVTDVNYIQYRVYLNNDGLKKLKSDTDVEITDTAGQGMEIDENSIRLERTIGTAGSEEDFEIEANSRVIRIHVPAEALEETEWILSYRTRITDFTRAKIKNDLEGEYTKQADEDPTEEVMTVWTNIVKASGDITGVRKGTLRIHKVLKGTETPIEGVTFTVKRQDGEVILEDQTELEMKTGADGYAELTQLPSGVYLITETSAPEWVEMVEESVSAEVKDTTEETPEITLVTVENSARQDTGMPETGSQDAGSMLAGGIMTLLAGLMLGYLVLPASPRHMNRKRF